MEQRFSAGKMLEMVTPLSPRGRLAFLLSCAERLVVNYAVFSEEAGWGDPAVLQEALDLGWKRLAGEVVTSAQTKTHIARCREVTPDTENFESDFVSPALDAAVCSALVLELMLGNDAKKVVDGASLSRDTVDMYVQEKESFDPRDPELEEKILKHPLMQRELRRQREDLGVLQQMESSGINVEDLVRRWRKPVTSNIDLQAP